MAIDVKEVLIFGGPLDGQRRTIPRDQQEIKLDVTPREHIRRAGPPEMPPPRVRTLSYHVRAMWQKCGLMFRTVAFATLGRDRALSRDQEGHIAREIHKRPWEPLSEVSLLGDFEIWWEVALYRATSNPAVLNLAFEIQSNLIIEKGDTDSWLNATSARFPRDR